MIIFKEKSKIKIVVISGRWSTTFLNIYHSIELITKDRWGGYPETYF